MIGFLFYPYEDEVLYSWIIRYHKYSINRFITQTKSDLFEKERMRLNIIYPNRIGKLLNNLPNEEMFELKNILKNMTLIDLVKPFTTIERYEKILYGLINSSKDTISIYGFHKNNLFKQHRNTMKVCTMCYREDKLKYGEPYLHRMHNIVGVRTCHKHGCYLDIIHIQFETSRGYWDIDKEFIPTKPEFPNGDIAVHYKNLNNDINLVVEGKLSHFDIEKIREKIKIELLNREIYRVYYPRDHPILKEFLDYYPKKFLQDMESDYLLNDEHIWLRDYLYNYNKKIINPIRQLLFIRYIFEGVKELSEYNKQFEPFGTAPYPCLNHLCDLYKIDVIKTYKIKKSARNDYLVGTFCCTNCGFTYTKASNNYNKYQYITVRDRGDLWKKTLKEMLDKGNYNIKILSEKMNVSKKQL